MGVASVMVAPLVAPACVVAAVSIVASEAQRDQGIRLRTPGRTSDRADARVPQVLVDHRRAHVSNLGPLGEAVEPDGLDRAAARAQVDADLSDDDASFSESDGGRWLSSEEAETILDEAIKRLRDRRKRGDIVF